jgi:hypothetical protein
MAETRNAACHCGQVKFTVELPEEVHGARCNCSICTMNGAVKVYVPLEAVQVTHGEDALSCYRFNTGVAKHYFCAHCGSHCFHQARSDPDQYGVNVACIEGMSPYDFTEVPVGDGARHSVDNGGVRRQFGTLRFIRSEE